MTIDFNCTPAWDQLLEVEQDANRCIWTDAPVEVLWPEPEALAALPYRSKKVLTGPVRLVRFPAADLCACCGTHVRSAGQVGLVKLLSCQKFRDGVRIELLCGQRAWRYLAQVWAQNQEISHALSARPLETAAAVARAQTELTGLRYQAVALENRLFAAMAEQFRGAGDVLLFQPELAPDALRRLAVAVSETCGGRCAAFSEADSGYPYAVAQQGAELGAFARAMNAALRGRGGGKGGLVQGSVQAGWPEIEAFFETLRSGEETEHAH